MEIEVVDSICLCGLCVPMGTRGKTLIKKLPKTMAIFLFCVIIKLKVIAIWKK